MIFIGLYKAAGKVWLQKFEADSWEEAEKIAQETGLYDIGKYITEIDA